MERRLSVWKRKEDAPIRLLILHGVRSFAVRRQTSAHSHVAGTQMEPSGRRAQTAPSTHERQNVEPSGEGTPQEEPTHPCSHSRSDSFGVKSGNEQASPATPTAHVPSRQVPVAQRSEQDSPIVGSVTQRESSHAKPRGQTASALHVPSGGTWRRHTPSSQRAFSGQRSSGAQASPSARSGAQVPTRHRAPWPHSESSTQAAPRKSSEHRPLTQKAAGAAQCAFRSHVLPSSRSGTAQVPSAQSRSSSQGQASPSSPRTRQVPPTQPSPSAQRPTSRPHGSSSRDSRHVPSSHTHRFPKSIRVSAHTSFAPQDSPRSRTRTQR